MSPRRTLVIACACSASVAAYADVPSPWGASASYSDQPTCQLHAPGVGEVPKGLVLVPYWNARNGWQLWFLTHLRGIQSVHFESVGTAEAWDVPLEAPRADFHGGRAVLDPAASDAMLRSLELGHVLRMTLKMENQPPLVFDIPSRNQRFAVPMYRACVKSLIDDPPTYLFAPDAYFSAHTDDGGQCVFRQLIHHGRFPVAVTVLTQAGGAEVVIDRETETRDPHRSYKRRTNPDRVDAHRLFGAAFDLLATYRYDISLEQLNQLAGELTQGKSRPLSFTNQTGKNTELQFGGRWAKPAAAMFAACRTVRSQ
jgi:hypothetical protein